MQKHYGITEEEVKADWVTRLITQEWKESSPFRGPERLPDGTSWPQQNPLFHSWNQGVQYFRVSIPFGTLIILRKIFTCIELNLNCLQIPLITPSEALKLGRRQVTDRHCMWQAGLHVVEASCTTQCWGVSFLALLSCSWSAIPTMLRFVCQYPSDEIPLSGS